MNQYEQFAQVMDEIRELLRAMVAGLVADGFTDEQAREIVTAMWRSTSEREEG